VMFWPTISITILLAVIGIWLIFYGLLLAVLAWQARSLGRAASTIRKPAWPYLRAIAKAMSEVPPSSSRDCGAPTALIMPHRPRLLC